MNSFFSNLKSPGWYKLLLLTLRIAVGWHFLYEGISKLYIENWTSYSYLSLSNWIFSDFFHWIADTPSVLSIVDFLNVWGLIFIGLALFLGVFTRIASTGGALLLLLYYFANPPLIGMDFGLPTEGSYLIVNKNVIELFVLILFVFLPSKAVPGIDRLYSYLKQRYTEKKESKNPYKSPTVDGVHRREVIKNLAALPFFGGFVIAAIKKKGWLSYEEKFLQPGDADAITAATKTFNFSSLKDLKEKVPSSKVIGGLDISRVILGGNLIGGWAHARELIYVSKLIKSYHTDERVFTTFRLAEECGINTFITNQTISRVINSYWHRGIGNIKFISDCGSANLVEGVRISIDHGASDCYIHGGYSDSFVTAGRIDKIAEALEFIKSNGIPGGIGAHRLETVKACVDYGLEPDFWMKTLHTKSYLNVKHELEPNRYTQNEEVMYNNVFCDHTEETVRYMSTLSQPWIAFKILAAGAIEPEKGFRYAFENGADFICVGMYDFQVVDNANLATGILNSDFKKYRPRPWLT